MALFQPTNITPDLKGGVKNGTIIVPYGSVLTSADISWTVNGNSKMVAYQIDFYKNDAGSTQTGSTGKITLGTPFSAVSANGAEARFTATVAISYIADAIQDSGTKREGKFKITQWWGAGANDYVEQRSLSVFVYSREGKLTIFAPTIVGGDAIFTGSYLAPSSLTYGDIPLNWTRWQLIQGSTDSPLQDTGKVWGATDYTWSPDTIAPGANYKVVFSAEMANGAEITAYSAFFNILQENTTTVTGVLTAGCDKAKGAASLTLNPYKYLTETVTGTAGWNGSTYAVDTDSSATFQIPGGQFSGAPWHFIWHGFLTNGKIFEISMKDGTKVYLQFNSGTNTLAFSPGTSTTYNSSPAMQLAAGKEIYAVFTTGFFKNSETTGFQWLVYSSDTGGWKNGKVIASFAQSEIVSVSLLAGSQTVNYAVGFGTANASLGAGLTDLTAAPLFYGPQARFPVTTTGGYKVAEMWYFGNQIGNYCLYRLDGNNNLVYVGMFEPWPDESYTTVLLDYSALNGETYQYLVKTARRAATRQSHTPQKSRPASGPCRCWRHSPTTTDSCTAETNPTSWYRRTTSKTTWRRGPTQTAVPGTFSPRLRPIPPSSGPRKTADRGR